MNKNKNKKTLPKKGSGGSVEGVQCVHMLGDMMDPEVCAKLTETGSKSCWMSGPASKAELLSSIPGTYLSRRG
jgi:hypothetical protein